MLTFPLFIVFPVAMVLAAASDVLTMKIPNKISLVLFVAFLIAAPLAGLSWQAIGIHLATGLAVLAVGFALFTRGWLGGGDAKLLAAGALWIGSQNLLAFLFAVTLCGAALCLAVLVYRRIVPTAYVPSAGWLQRLHGKEAGVPYGLAICGGALLLYPQTPLFMALGA